MGNEAMIPDKTQPPVSTREGAARKAVEVALGRVRRSAEGAAQAADTDEAKRRLQDVWHAVRHAIEACNDAERARAGFIAKLEHAA